MKTFFLALIGGHVFIVLMMLVFVFIRKNLYDRLNAIFAMNTNIVILILIVGMIDGRFDMYIDIALSYAVLGFVTTAILAKYIGGRK